MIDYQEHIIALRAMQAEREAALQELRFHVDDAVKAWNAHEAAEATVASLQAQVEAMRGALDQIAWSNDSKWQADCARAALEGEKPDKWQCPINYPGCKKNCGGYGCGN